MSGDKVTLRINAVATYRVVDPRPGGLHGERLSKQAPLPRGSARPARPSSGNRAGSRLAPCRQGSPGGRGRGSADSACSRARARGDGARHSRPDSAGRHQGLDEQGHRSQEGGQRRTSSRGEKRRSRLGSQANTAKPLGREPDAERGCASSRFLESSLRPASST